MASKIVAFFDKIGHGIKVGAEDIAKDFKTVFTDVFGANAFADLETTAETLFKTELGQAVLTDAQTQLAAVQSGTTSLDTAIANLASTVVKQGETAGKSIGQALATMVASMAVAKLQGAITAIPAAAPAPPAAPAAA